MEKVKVNKFLKKDVAVGIKNYSYPNKLFFYYGKMTELNDECLVLEYPTGIKQISLADILDIHLVTHA